MKKLTLITLLLGVVGIAFGRTSGTPQDSVVILFGNNTRIIIHAKDKEELKALKKYDFNTLLNQVVTVMEKDTRQDTTLIMEGDTVIMKGGQVVIKAKEKEAVTFSIKIGDREGNARVEVIGGDTTVTVKKEKKWKRTRKEFTLDLGLNNYLANRKFPDYDNVEYALRTWGSRYVALGYQFQTRLGGRKSPFLFHYGLEASFNNFMFDSDQRLSKGPNGVIFEAVPGTDNLRKSKLTVIYANLPIMAVLDFGKSSTNRFRVGVGGFIGYRVHSYTKIMYFKDGDKQKDHQASNFYLNNLHYGVQGTVGFKDIDLFIKYDLNPLFAAGRGPSPNDLQVISFGIRL